MPVIGDEPTIVDLIIVRGDDFRAEMTNPIVFQVGDTWRAQIRDTVDDPTINLTFGFDTSALASGLLVMTATDAETTALTLPDDGGWWDLERTRALFTRTLFQGGVTFKKDVTK